MGWRADKANTTAQLANVSDGTTLDKTYWEAYAYLQIKNILTGMAFAPPVDQDFTDITTALADSDVQTAGILLVTTAHTTAATLTIPVANFSLRGVGRTAAITSAASSSYHLITVNAKDGCEISGLRLVGGTSATGDVIRVTDADRLWVRNVEFAGAGTYAIQETGTSQNNQYTDCQSIAFTASTPPDVKLVAGSSGHISAFFMNVS
jgi:hypothetical protein